MQHNKNKQTNDVCCSAESACNSAPGSGPSSPNNSSSSLPSENGVTISSSPGEVTNRVRVFVCMCVCETAREGETEGEKDCMAQTYCQESSTRFLAFFFSVDEYLLKFSVCFRPPCSTDWLLGTAQSASCLSTRLPLCPTSLWGCQPPAQLPPPW